MTTSLVFDAESTHGFIFVKLEYQRAGPAAESFLVVNVFI